MNNPFYICALDFEVTCWKDNQNHEIIEFTSVMLEQTFTQKNQITENKITQIFEIHCYVKPKIYHVISDFLQ